MRKADHLLEFCRNLIEEKLGLGPSDGWTTQDFETLSDRIEQETSVLLSVTTLKRIWGRVKYDSAPTATTLNVLARFAGYPSWVSLKDFFESRQMEEKKTPVSTPLPEARRTRYIPWALIGALLIVMAVVSAFIFKKAGPAVYNSNDFSFSSERLDVGIPNSVLFRYDASAVKTGDSVFIQQSWDTKRRRAVSRDGRNHMSIYYYPGYYKAKLIVGKQVVQEHDLYIPSEDWVVAVKQDPVPVYFPKEETRGEGVLHLPAKALQEKNIPLHPVVPDVRYRIVPPMKQVLNDNFIFETRIKNETLQGAGVCQKAEIVLLCQDGVFLIPLSTKACTGDLRLMLPGYYKRSAEADLSLFGCDLSQWTDVKCVVKDRLATIWVNNKKAYEAEFPMQPTALVGISYEFEGPGSVDYAKLTALDGAKLFDDDFEK